MLHRIGPGRLAGRFALLVVPALLGIVLATAPGSRPTAAAAPLPSPLPSEQTPTPTPFPVTATPVVAVSTPWFNEEDVDVSTPQSLSAMTVVITIQRTPGLSFSGEYDTVGSQVQQSSSSTDSTITYTFTLISGTLAAGRYVFAAQTSGSGTGHPASGDTTLVTFTIGGVFGETGGRF